MSMYARDIANSDSERNDHETYDFLTLAERQLRMGVYIKCEAFGRSGRTTAVTMELFISVPTRFKWCN